MFSQRPWKNQFKIKLNIPQKSNCKAIEPLLWGHAASQLNSDENARVLIHLAQCELCCQLLEAYQQTVRGITGLRGRQIPASLTTWHTLQARLRAESTTQPPLASSQLLNRSSIAAGFTLCSSVLLRFGGSTVLAAACLLIGMMTTWHDKPGSTSDLQQGKHERQSIALNHTELFPANSPSLLKPYLSNPFLAEQHSKERPKLRLASLSPSLVMPRRLQSGTAAPRFVLKTNYPSVPHFARGGLKTYAHGHLRKSSSRNLLQEAAFKRSAWTLPAVGMENEMGQAETYFVLTTVEDNRKTQTNYVMDSVDTDAQKAVMQTKIEGSNRDNMPTGKEIQGW